MEPKESSNNLNVGSLKKEGALKLYKGAFMPVNFEDSKSTNHEPPEPKLTSTHNVEKHLKDKLTKQSSKDKLTKQSSKLSEDYIKSREVGEPNAEEYASMQEAVEQKLMYEIHRSDLEQFVSDQEKYNYYLKNKSKWKQELTSEQNDDLSTQIVGNVSNKLCCLCGKKSFLKC